MAKLLIVDDEHDVREFAANFFRRRKIDVSTASSGTEAIQKVETDKPNLILLDVKMAGIDGIETLERIKKIDNAIKIIMVTGKKPEEDSALSRCISAGALDYIHKPLELDILEKVVMKELLNMN